MNLELVPCMFKSRAGDGKESEVVGFVIRTPGSTTGTIVPTTSTPPTTSKPGTTVAKPQKIQPRRSDPVIAPKRIESFPQKILPAPLTTSLSNGAISNKNFGIGSYIDIPITALGQSSAAVPASAPPSTKPPPKPRSKSTKAKAKSKIVEEVSIPSTTTTILPAPPSFPSTSFEMQSPPQLLPTDAYPQSSSVNAAVVSSSPPSYLPPISAIANGTTTINGGTNPSTSYQQQNPQPSQRQQQISSNGCTSEDLNAIEIADSLSNDHWNNNHHHQQQQQQPHSSHSNDHYYNYDSNYTSYHHQSHSQSHSQQPQTASHSGSNGYPPSTVYPHTSTEYGNHEQANGYCHQNTYVHQPNPTVAAITNGHHNGNGHWIPQPRQLQQQQQYAGVQNQMTSSTPDSGIQSIDGSPPSTSAFTPPMVSPYPLQANHFDSNLTQTTMAPHQQLPSISTQYSAGPMGPSMRSRLSTDGGGGIHQSSHIHLPPLNCMLSSNSGMNSSITTNNITNKNYLGHQHPSCSYQNEPLICETELDDISRIEPVQSISPPGLEHEKRKEGEEDEDCDYSDMPTLIRGDMDKEIHAPPSEATKQTSSRISNGDDEKKTDESPQPQPKVSDAIAINPNMDANEIAKMLMSSLPSEKVQELLRSFRPAIEEEGKKLDDASSSSSSSITTSEPSTSTVIPPSSNALPSKNEEEEGKKEEEEKEIKPAPKKKNNPAPKGGRRRNSGKQSASSSNETDKINGVNERPSTRSSIRNSSPPRSITPPPLPPAAAVTEGKNVKQNNSRAPSKKSTPTLSASAAATKNKTSKISSKVTKNNDNSVNSKTKQPLKVSKKKSAPPPPASLTSTTKTKLNKIKVVENGRNSRKKKNEKAIISVLKTHPFLRNHRTTFPSSYKKYKLIEASRPRKNSLSSLSISKGKLPFYGLGRSRLEGPLPKEFDQFLNEPSKLITSRYEGCSTKLAKLFQQTHLGIPKVPMVKWEPSGSWKSAFDVDRKRKAPISAKQEQPPKKISKIDNKKSIKKNNEKLGPLKITIRKDSSDADEIINEGNSKKKKISMITPIPKDIDYVKIRSNIIVESPPKLTTASKMCECEDSDPCTSTSKCPSRMAHVECTHYSCHLFNTCQNRRIESNLSVHQLQIFKHPTMNHGVRSLTDISKDHLVCEFVGEVMRKNTYLKRLEMAQSYPHYGIELIPGSYVIDASKKGNLSRFMNHSCEPNCIMQRWIVRGEQRIGIFALKDIVAGVELTYNYSMHVFLKEKIKCLCESTNCAGIIPSMPPPTKAPSKPEKLTQPEVELIKKERIFLQRNLRKYNTEREISIPSPIPSMPEISKCIVDIFNQFIHSSCDKLPRRWLQHFSIMIRKVFATTPASDVVELIERFDTNIKNCLSMISKSLERRQSDSLQHQYLQIKRQSNISEFLKDSHPNILLSFLAERPRTRKNDHSPRILSATTDLSYMNSEYPVGSYDPDAESPLFSQKCCPDGDSIRCVCGIMDEGGEMYQCDQCSYWLHRDCLDLSAEPDEYVCPFCEKNLKTTPLLDILLTPQYDYRIDKCVYYKTLVNCRGIQVRVNECVYVERIINDEYKRRLKQFYEEHIVDGKTKSKKRKLSSVSLPANVEEPPESIFKPDAQRIFDRKDLRTFRVERLFKAPTGERYAFGCYYARPHETFVDPGRMFYKNELFWTPLFDTLPLDVIVGRCLCLEPQEYASGRPKGPKYLEDDVFVCEYSIDKAQKVFEKISLKNRYIVNTADYLFDRFEKPLTMKRNFTPFHIKTDNKKANEKSSKNKLSTVAKQTGTIRLHQCVDKHTIKP